MGKKKYKNDLIILKNGMFGRFLWVFITDKKSEKVIKLDLHSLFPQQEKRIYVATSVCTGGRDSPPDCPI